MGLNVEKIKVGNTSFDFSAAVLNKTTYANLVTLRNQGNLKEGAFYQITDYVTTTTQENTRSAGNLFDIIVQADSTNTLSEIAHATYSDRDTNHYFSGANLNAWELKYCLDNDTDRFLWADDTNGKGVIYYMKDEWNNECPYDFKNIQFKRYKITECIKSPDLEGLYSIQGANGIEVDTETIYWSYTFCMYDLNEGGPCDVSTYQNKYLSGEGFCYKNHDNNFESYIEPTYDEDGSVPMTLANNVFITDTDICAIEESYGEFYGFYSNTFGNDCYSNTFGNNVYQNTFGNGFRYNTFGNAYNYNTFGNKFYNNKFGNDCYSNTFGNECYNNTFGNGFRYNTFGNNVQYNTFGNYCYSNTFGNYCYQNTFGNGCYQNTFGNAYNYNTFGNGCYQNTFGNECYNNTFGNGCGSNTFGNGCNNIRYQKDYIYYTIVENGNQYIDVSSTTTTSSSNVLRNFTIVQGVNNSTTRKTISHNTVNDTFKTTYQNSSSTTVNV